MHEVFCKSKNLADAMEYTKWHSKNKQNVCDYRLLMVKRSGLSSFMANAFVFPGGLVETADYSPKWWTVFEKLGISKEELKEFCNAHKGLRPPMVTEPLTLKSTSFTSSKDDAIPSDVALRIAALRETFEETGILLLTNPALESSPEATTYTFMSQNIDIQHWQEKIHKDPNMFVDLCLESHTCPDIWSLFEWSNWLTPTSVGHRRYDTMFYICCLPRQPDVLLDKSEVTVMRWWSPEEILEENSMNTVFLAPPQAYELSRLIHFHSFHELHDFAKTRGTKGCERWIPIINTAVDGAVSLLPGDELYPEDPDLYGVKKSVEYSYALEDMRSRSKCLHRMEIRGPHCTMYCTVSPACGHLQPLTYRPTHPVIQSFL